MFVFRKCFIGQHFHWLSLLILVLEIASVIFNCFSAAHCCYEYVCSCYVRFPLCTMFAKYFTDHLCRFTFWNLVSSLTTIHQKKETTERMFHNLLAKVQV